MQLHEYQTAQFLMASDQQNFFHKLRLTNMNSPAHLLRNDLTLKRETLRQAHQSINLMGSKSRPSIAKRCSVTLSNNYPSYQVQNMKSRYAQGSPQYIQQSSSYLNSKYSNTSQKCILSYDSNGRTNSYSRNDGLASRIPSAQPKIVQEARKQVKPSEYSESSMSMSHRKNEQSIFDMNLGKYREKYSFNQNEEIKGDFQSSFSTDMRYSLMNNGASPLQESLISITSLELARSKELSRECETKERHTTKQIPLSLTYKLSEQSEKLEADKKVEELNRNLLILMGRVDKNERDIKDLQMVSEGDQKMQPFLTRLTCLEDKSKLQYAELKSDLAEIHTKSQKISQNYHLVLKQMQEEMKKYSEFIQIKSEPISFQTLETQLSILRLDFTHHNQLFQKQIAHLKQQLQAHIHNLLAYPRTSLSLESLRTTKKSISSQQLSLTTTIQSPSLVSPVIIHNIYKIDQEGFLLDENQQYLVDSHGVLYQLDDTHINLLKSNGIIS